MPIQSIITYSLANTDVMNVHHGEVRLLEAVTAVLLLTGAQLSIPVFSNT